MWTNAEVEKIDNMNISCPMCGCKEFTIFLVSRYLKCWSCDHKWTPTIPENMIYENH